jgi:hypothetical protein
MITTQYAPWDGSRTDLGRQLLASTLHVMHESASRGLARLSAALLAWEGNSPSTYSGGTT